MGIYDRDYYRREGPSLLGRFAERGAVCKWLIGINVAAFILQLVTYQPDTPRGETAGFTGFLLLDAAKVLHGEIWRLLTYAFLHSTSTPWHILWNMVFLWWFGSDMEELYGPREFLIFYLLAALFGGVVHVLLTMVGWMPGVPVIGASGAVTAVLLLCAIHYPSRVILLFFILPVPIWLFVFVSIGLDMFHFFGRQYGGTAVDVHLAGALFAFLYYKRQWRFTTLGSQFQAWRKRRAQPQLRVFRPEEELEREPVGAAVATATYEDEQLEAKVDAILEKISRTGKESLTENERQVLLRASEMLKRRRR